METTKVKKELYYCDKWEFAETLKNHEKMLLELNNLAQYYRDLGFKKPFDKHSIVQAMTNTTEFMQELTKDLLEDFEKLPTIAQNVFREEVNKKIRKFEEKVKEVRESAKASEFHSHYRHSIDFGMFEVDKSGKITLSDTSRESLKGLCSVYVENETQQRVIELMAEVNQRFEMISDILKRNGINTTLWPETPERRGVFTIKEDYNYQLKPEILGRIKNV